MRILGAILLLCVLCGAQLKGFADDKTPAGQVIASQGSAKAVGPDNASRDLKRGASVFPKDKIIVDADSKVQIKFSDGGLINLIAITEYLIDSYSFKDASQSDVSSTTLVKGGFRMLSGTIAKENPSSHTVKTPVATIGLRGTTFAVNFVSGKVFVACSSGQVECKNSLGSVVIGAGAGNAYASVGANTAPVALAQMPAALAPSQFAAPPGGQSIEAAEAAQSAAGTQGTPPSPNVSPTAPAAQQAAPPPVNEALPSLEIEVGSNEGCVGS